MAYFKSFVLANQSWPPKIITPTQLRTKTPYYKSLSLIIHKTLIFFPHSLSLCVETTLEPNPEFVGSPTQTSLVLPLSLSHRQMAIEKKISLLPSALSHRLTLTFTNAPAVAEKI
jgi:hypothetical protein